MNTCRNLSNHEANEPASQPGMATNRPFLTAEQILVKLDDQDLEFQDSEESEDIANDSTDDPPYKNESEVTQINLVYP